MDKAVYALVVLLALVLLVSASAPRRIQPYVKQVRLAENGTLVVLEIYSINEQNDFILPFSYLQGARERWSEATSSS